MAVKLACMGDKCKCSFGTTPAAFTPFPGPPATQQGKPAGTIVAMTPANFAPNFGMCSSLQNPAVSSATAADEGTLTPQPCVPAVATPWISPQTMLILVGGQPALGLQNSQAMCAYGGKIEFQQ